MFYKRKNLKDLLSSSNHFKDTVKIMMLLDSGMYTYNVNHMMYRKNVINLSNQPDLKYQNMVAQLDPNPSPPIQYLIVSSILGVFIYYYAYCTKRYV